MRVLIEHLPPNGARARAIKGHAWTDETYLAAINADRIGEAAAGIIRALGGKASRPKALPRPGKNDNRLGDRGNASPEDVLNYLNTLKPA